MAIIVQVRVTLGRMNGWWGGTRVKRVQGVQWRDRSPGLPSPSEVIHDSQETENTCNDTDDEGGKLANTSAFVGVVGVVSMQSEMRVFFRL